MGLFSNKEKKSEKDIPALPRLPRLPDFPDMDDRTIHQLPSFPSNSLGKKFSRDTIKDAVSGERGEEYLHADEVSDDDEARMMQEPLRKPMTEEMEEYEEAPRRTERMKEVSRVPSESSGPVFVRIDRFEEGLKLLEGIKSQISDIEGILAETKRLKEKEEEELNSWGNELKKMKMEMEKMGSDIFSKV